MNFGLVATYVVRSFPLLSPPCLPSWTWRNVANMCIMAIRRWLPWATSIAYPTSFWSNLDASNTILTTFWRIWCYFGDIWTKAHLQSIENISKTKASKPQSLEASKPRSLEASKCLGGNREAKSISSTLHQFNDAPLHKSGWPGWMRGAIAYCVTYSFLFSKVLR